MSVIVDTCTKSHSVKKQYLSECSNIAFSQAISMIPSSKSKSVNDLLDNFNAKILNVIDEIAPVKIKVISGKQKAPWRNAPHVRLHKRMCRRAERRW